MGVKETFPPHTRQHPAARAPSGTCVRGIETGWPYHPQQEQGSKESGEVGHVPRPVPAINRGGQTVPQRMRSRSSASRRSTCLSFVPGPARRVYRPTAPGWGLAPASLGRISTEPQNETERLMEGHPYSLAQTGSGACLERARAVPRQHSRRTPTAFCTH